MRAGLGDGKRVFARRPALRNMVPGLLAAVLVLAGILAAGCSAGGGPGESHQRHGTYIGVYQPGNSTSISKVNGFGQAIGYRPDIVLSYTNWLDPFPSRMANRYNAIGATPLVQMEPVGAPLADVAAGRYDSYLRSFALAVKAFGHPVVIGFGHEMNGKWYSWGRGHTPPSVWIAAWRHVVSLFRQQGARHVIWLWTINRDVHSPGLVRDWWPGAAYVTWVGIDGYYFLPTDTFQSAFGSTIRSVRSFTNEPIILSENAIGQISGKAAKLPGLFAGIRHYNLLGVVWFDVSRSGSLYRQDWRLEGNPAAISAFHRGVESLGGVRPAPGG